MVVSGRAWPCAAVVRGRARLCMRGRACVVVRGPSCVVVRGRAQSCVVVRGRQSLPFCPLRGQHCSGTNARTDSRTTYTNPLNPPGVGWVKFLF